MLIMSNRLKILGFFAAIVVLPSFIATSAHSEVRIHGQNFPDGCREITRIVDEVRMWGVDCPTELNNPRIERSKAFRPPLFGGFPSDSSVKRQPAFQSFARCDAALDGINNTLGDVMGWFHEVINGPPSSRVLTAEAALSVNDRLRSYIMNIMDHGESIYRNRKRGEDGAGKCAEFIKVYHDNLKYVFALVKSEAAKGNRDLIGTGLNPYQSQYNN